MSSDAATVRQERCTNVPARADADAPMPNYVSAVRRTASREGAPSSTVPASARFSTPKRRLAYTPGTAVGGVIPRAIYVFARPAGFGVATCTGYPSGSAITAMRPKLSSCGSCSELACDASALRVLPLEGLNR